MRQFQNSRIGAIERLSPSSPELVTQAETRPEHFMCADKIEGRFPYQEDLHHVVSLATSFNV